MRSRVAPSPPKDRRFLALNVQWKGDGRGNWSHNGEQWIEAWWDGDKYRIWCGKAQSFTSEPLTMIEWAELPECIYK